MSERHNSTRHVKAGEVPLPIICAVFAIIFVCAGLNMVFAGEPWLQRFNTFCWVAGPIIMIGILLLFLFNNKVRSALHVQRESTEEKYPRVGQRKLYTTPVRPDVYGESYNAWIDEKSTSNIVLSINPLWRLHLVASVLTLAVLVLMSLTVFVTPINPFDRENMQTVPDNPVIYFFATLPPGLKVFFILFGIACLLLMLNGLRKPLREVCFDRSYNQCKMSKVWFFGVVRKEVSTHNLSEVIALQLLTYTDRQAALHHNRNTGNLSKNDSYSGSRHPTSEYELNLVYDDGTRVNVINHRYERGIKRDAIALQQWLNVPLHDQTNHYR